jgi:uncharacterized membrane protein
VLWWFGLRLRSPTLGFMGLVLLGMGVVRLLAVDTPWHGREPFVPVFNRYGLAALTVAACVLAAGISARAFRTREGDPLHRAAQSIGLAGVALVWVVLSLETSQYFTAREAVAPQDTLESRLVARMSLSLLWAAYAGVLLWVGFRLRSDPLRWAALGLFGLTLLKVMFVDTAELSGFYRVAVFFALALVMGAGAWAYQGWRAAQQAEEGEEVAHV